MSEIGNKSVEAGSRAVGEVPADVEGLLREADEWTKPGARIWVEPQTIAAMQDTIGRLAAALRGRVVGAAAPGAREAFEAWCRNRGNFDLTRWVGNTDTYADSYVNSAWTVWQAALTSAAPPPVVPQVVHSLRTRLAGFGAASSGAVFWRQPLDASAWTELFQLAADAIAALGAAPTDLQAVGLPSSPTQCEVPRSSPTPVPLTEREYGAWMVYNERTGERVVTASHYEMLFYQRAGWRVAQSFYSERGRAPLSPEDGTIAASPPSLPLTGGKT